MAKLKVRQPRTSERGRDVSAEALPDHEGPRPDWSADAETWRRWREIRSARTRRECGGSNDPRHLLVNG
jgi:hypothetical protein